MLISVIAWLKTMEPSGSSASHSYRLLPATSSGTGFPVRTTSSSLPQATRPAPAPETAPASASSPASPYRAIVLAASVRRRRPRARCAVRGKRVRAATAWLLTVIGPAVARCETCSPWSAVRQRRRESGHGSCRRIPARRGRASRAIDRSCRTCGRRFRSQMERGAAADQAVAAIDLLKYRRFSGLPTRRTPTLLILSGLRLLAASSSLVAFLILNPIYVDQEHRLRTPPGLRLVPGVDVEDDRRWPHGDVRPVPAGPVLGLIPCSTPM